MNNRRPLNLQGGFTITELTIAMGFLTILMFILLVSSMQFVSIFNKGITLKRVNQSGRTVGAELQNSLRHTNVEQRDAVVSTPPVALGSSGQLVSTRACTGSYSYIWSVYGKNDTDIIEEKYIGGARVGFAKVKDNNGKYCENPSMLVDKSESTELIADGLVIRQPVSFQRTADGKLTTFTYTISTPDDNEDLEFDVNGHSTCKGGSTRDFCALNTFSVTVYSKGI